MLYTLIVALIIVLVVMLLAGLVGIDRRIAGIIALLFVLVYLFGDGVFKRL